MVNPTPLSIQCVYVCVFVHVCVCVCDNSHALKKKKNEQDLLFFKPRLASQPSCRQTPPSWHHTL